MHCVSCRISNGECLHKFRVHKRCLDDCVPKILPVECEAVFEISVESASPRPFMYNLQMFDVRQRPSIHLRFIRHSEESIPSNSARQSDGAGGLAMEQ